MSKSDFNVEEYIVQKMFYGYTHGDLTEDYVEDTIVGVTVWLETDDKLLPRHGDSGCFFVNHHYNQNNKFLEEMA